MMKKAMTILYEVHDNIYVNLTNKCPCSCVFCLRQTRNHMENSNELWLEHDVTEEELFQAFRSRDMSKYKEVVFLALSRLEDKSYDAMLDFAEKCRKYVPHVVMITVDTTITHQEEEQCKKICEEMGAVYRIRPWED